MRRGRTGHVVLAGGICAAPLLAVVGCEQILGVEGQTFLRDAAVDAGPGPADAGANPDSGCGPDAKELNGTCVPLDRPELGCADPASTPCSLPFAATEKCVDGACAVATCQPGHDDCNGDASDGCEADLLAPKTCGTCTHSCPDSAPLCGPDDQGTIGCLVQCTGTTQPCTGSCVDLTTSITNCGSCGHPCGGAPNADPACAASACGIACRTNYGDCDGNQTDGCEPLVVFFQDDDGDGFGQTGATTSACTVPKGYATKGGDCADKVAQAFPGQPLYFGVGYATPAGATSYDYDCDGAETESTGTVHFKSCDSCGAPGHLPGAVRPGADSYCGSTLSASCVSSSGSESASCSESQFSVAPVTCK